MEPAAGPPPGPPERPSAPDWLSGAWWRTRLVLDGRVVRHAGIAVWVHDGASFLDLRGPGPTGLCGPRIFAGTTSWAAPHLRWHHRFDSVAGVEDLDVGRVVLRNGGELVATGVFPGPDGSLSYRERWDRLLGPSDVTVRVDASGVHATSSRPLPLEIRLHLPSHPQQRQREH